MCEDWRAPLCGAFCHELECDLSDVHILCSLAAQLRLESVIPTLISYRDDPHHWIDLISRLHNIPRSVAKQWPAVIVAGGLHVYHSWLQSMMLESSDAQAVQGFIRRIAAEAAILASEVLRHPRFRWTHTERQRLLQCAAGTNENNKGNIDTTDATITTALLNQVLRSCESEILSILHRTLNGLRWQVRSKIFDSVLVEPRPDATVKSISEVMTACTDAWRTHGWTVTMVEKPLFGLQDKPIKTVIEARQALLEISRSVLRRRRSSSAKHAAAAVTAAGNGRVEMNGRNAKRASIS